MKVCLAAVESLYGHKPCRETDFLKDINHFYSFFYAQNKIDGYLFYEGRLKIVDSGAHTFFAATDVDIGFPMEKREKLKLTETPEEYVKRYIKWIQKYYDNFDYFVELDVQELVGYDTVLKWRQWYKDAGISTKMMHCYHQCNTFDEYKEMVDKCDSRYVGLEGVRKNRKPLPYNKFIKYAYDNKCRVHGFAMIKKEYVNKHPFYSVDSSSWQVPLRWGSYYFFIPKEGKFRVFVNSLKQIDKVYSKAIEKKRKKCFKLNTPAEFLESYNDEVVKMKLRMTVEANIQFEKYYTDLWERRGINWEKQLSLPQ